MKSFFSMILRSAGLFVVFLLVGALFIEAPLQEIADPSKVPNPVKAAWFLLWIQEAVSWSKSLIWPVAGLFLLFIVLPWLPRGAAPEKARWFQKHQPAVNTLTVGVALLVLFLTVIAFFFRTQNWAFGAESPLWGGRPVACLPCHGDQKEKGQCTECHRGDPRSVRKESAHRGLIRGKLAEFTNSRAKGVQAGMRWIETLGCRRCHRIGEKGAVLASNLDQSAKRKDITLLDQAIEKAAYWMPDFHLSTELREQVLAALLNAGLSWDERKGADLEVPRLVHFESGSAPKGVFEEKCGSCHRLLNSKKGGLGDGQIGPDLSGLLGPWYPVREWRSKPWTKELVEKWVSNPRGLKKNAVMQPVVLDREQFQGLGESLE